MIVLWFYFCCLEFLNILFFGYKYFWNNDIRFYLQVVDLGCGDNTFLWILKIYSCVELFVGVDINDFVLYYLR